MRTQTEIKLMNLRQKYRDHLIFLKGQSIIQIQEYRLVYLWFTVCDQVLAEYRKNSAA